MFEYNVVPTSQIMSNSLSDSLPNDKNIVLSFSLLMRLFEWCHEDAKDDLDMHKVMEKLVAFSDGHTPLKIDVYDCLIKDVQEPSCEDSCDNYSNEEDLQNAYNLGQEYAEDNCELSSDGRDYSVVAGQAIKDETGEGASNNELECFWNGYDDNSATITLFKDDEQEQCDNCVDDDTNAEIEKLIMMSRI